MQARTCCDQHRAVCNLLLYVRECPDNAFSHIVLGSPARSRKLDSDLYGSLPTGDTLSALQPPAAETLQVMADTVVQSKPRPADAASVKLLIFANGVVLFNTQEITSCL